MKHPPEVPVPLSLLFVSYCILCFCRTLYSCICSCKENSIKGSIENKNYSATGGKCPQRTETKTFRPQKSKHDKKIRGKLTFGLEGNTLYLPKKKYTSNI